jgi:hypothetical protein
VRPEQSCTTNHTTSRVAVETSTIVEAPYRWMSSVIGKIA